MAKQSDRTHLSLLLLLVSACAQGVDSVDMQSMEPATRGAAGTSGGGAGESAAGSASVGGTANAGSSSAGSAAGSSGSATGGSGNAAGSANGGSGNAAGSANGGSANGGSANGGSANGGSANAGAASGGGVGGASSGGNTSNAGSGGAPAAPCSGKKPEANCTCQSHNTHDYWFCPTARDFSSSEANCVSAGLHLAHVTSAAEDKWVNDAANAASFGEYYLGSTDASMPNTWAWLAGGTFWTGLANGTASGYAHWNSGEPNGSGDCLVVQTGFVWDDRICTDQRKYICD